MSGGVAPGGKLRTAVCDAAVICAVAASILAPGWKKTLITATPVRLWLSVCLMSLTVVIKKRSKLLTTRFSISSGGRPA